MTQARIELTAVDKTKLVIDGVKKNLGSLGDTVGALPARFGTLGVAIAAAFSTVTIKGSLDVLDSLDDLSEKTGIAVESLSGLRYAGEVVGTPIEAIAAGTKKLAVNMTEAAAGNKEALATFKTLNVEIRNADGSLRSQDAVLLDIADRFVKYEDGAGKAALAQRAFGKTGADLIPLLNQGSAGIRQLRSEAEALGLVYGGELAKQAAQFNDNLKKLELNAEAAKVQLVGGLLPSLNRLLETYIELRKHGVVWTAIEQGLISIAKYVPVVSTMARVLEGFRGGRQLSDNPGEDINRFMAERAQILRRREFAAKKSLPTDGFDQELRQIEDLLKVSRVYQANAALDGVGDMSDAVSRRLGRKRAAPITPGEGSDKAAKERERELKERAKLIAELAGLSGSFAEDWARLNALFKDGTLTLDQLTTQQAKLLEQQPFMQERVRSEKELADAREKAASLGDKSLAHMVQENDELAKSNQTLADQIEMIGLTEKEVRALTLARLEANLQLERERLLMAQNIEGNEKEVEQIERRIRLLQRQKELTGVEFDKKASTAAAEEWRGDLRGALQRAFEDSKNPGKAFIEAFASTLYTRVSAKLADAIMDAMFGKATGGAGGGILGAFMGGGGALSAAFSQTSIGSSGFGTGLAYGNQDLGAFFHDGGVVGGKPSFSRRVNSSVWRGAPRFHTGGIAGDEVPIIAKRGEGVFTPEQMRALGGRGARNVTINMPVTVGDVVTGDRLRSEMQVLKRQMIAGLQRARNYGGEPA